jgi:hypothetical protein
MTRSQSKVEECCSWCRQPVSACTRPACDDARTYSGVMLRGEWKEMEEAERRQPAAALS